MYHPVEPFPHARNLNVNPYAAPGIKPELMPGKEISTEGIINAVCFYTQQPYNTLTTKSRERGIVVARQLCMYFLKKKTSASLREIGLLFGGRDHTTSIHSINTIKNLLDAKDEAITQAVQHINSVI